MKILNMAKRALLGSGAVVDDVEKRTGIYVSRKLDARNAKKWHDWAVKHGVPDPVPPEKMHVTIIYSPDQDAKVPLVETGLNISTTRGDWGYGGFFALFGQDEDALVFTFSAFELHDRHWAFISAGCVCNWPNYRPHLTLSENAAGFELSDEALTDVPAHIVLGPEVAEAPKAKSAASVEKGDSPVEVTDAMKAEAASLLETQKDAISLIDAYDLADIKKGRLVAGVAKRLAAEPWATEALKAAAEPKISTVKKKVEKDIEIKVSQLPEDIIKKLAGTEIAKNNDEEQIVMGIASVSTINGEFVKDLHGDEVTTQALVEFNRSLITGSRAGKFDHEGEVCTEVVAGLVLTDDWQKALGIDLGYEPYLVEIHVPDTKDWAEVKKGEWMLSVAGRMYYYEDADDAEV